MWLGCNPSCTYECTYTVIEPAHPTSDTFFDKHHYVNIGEKCQYCSSILEHGISHEARSYTVVSGIHSIQAGM